MPKSWEVRKEDESDLYQKFVETHDLSINYEGYHLVQWNLVGLWNVL